MRKETENKKRRSRAALLAALFVAGTLLAACAKPAEQTSSEPATSSSKTESVAKSETASEQASSSEKPQHGDGVTIEEATAGLQNNPDVDARILAEAYMRYQADGITKGYDALAYSNLFPRDFQSWYEDSFGIAIEEVCNGMEAKVGKKGEFTIEEVEDAAALHSEENIDKYIEGISGEKSSERSDIWRDLEYIMNKWYIKRAYRFVYTTETVEGKPCEAEFYVLNVGTGWYVDPRDLQGPKITEI